MFASMIPHRYLYQSLAFPLTREQDPQMFRLVPRPESALRQPFPAEQHGLRFGGANSHHFFVQSCSNMTAQKLGLLRAVSPTPEKEPPPVIPRHPQRTVFLATAAKARLIHRVATRRSVTGHSCTARQSSGGVFPQLRACNALPCAGGREAWMQLLSHGNP